MSVETSQESISLFEVRKLIQQQPWKKHGRPPPTFIPISKTITDDELHPIKTFLKIRRGPYSFLAESVFDAEKVCQHTFMSSEPDLIFETNGCDPLLEVENYLKNRRILCEDDFPEYLGVPAWMRCITKFMGGAFGYINYDSVTYFEPKVQSPKQDNLNIPESIFMIFNTFVVHDNVYKCSIIITLLDIGENANIDDSLLESNYNKCLQKLNELENRLLSEEVPYPEEFLNLAENSQPTPISELHSNMGKEGYMKTVDFMKEHIKIGDIIQAVPSHRITRPTFAHPFNIYRELRALNPSPYMFYLDLKIFQIVGASPECLVRVDSQRTVYTYPIAGTDRRGKTRAQDLAIAKNLINNEKERSEHVMLVDLGRNDVNRVCEPESVNVPKDKFMNIEYYSHVMHIVSKVVGTLRPEKTPFDAFRSIFPAGTLSGAPKIKAMELISQCENEKRGVYGGSVGYMSYNNVLDTCIAIRTILVKDGIAYLQSGGGIVLDSEKEAEYQETVSKMTGPLRAIEAAERKLKNKFEKGEKREISKLVYSVKNQDHSDTKIHSISLQNHAQIEHKIQTKFEHEGKYHVLMIDNYDSFTYNLYQYLSKQNAEVIVYRNDKVTLSECISLKPTHIVISPGPGHPRDSGISNEVISHFTGKIPILGVCLGHQAIVEIFGGIVSGSGEIRHGKTSKIRHDGKGVFNNLPLFFNATRYHSLAGKELTLRNSPLEITAWSETGVIMGVRHKTYTIEGVQFHPESIFTEYGLLMLENFLKLKGGEWANNENQTLLNIQANGIENYLKVLNERSGDFTGLLEGIRLGMRDIMSGRATHEQMKNYLVSLPVLELSADIVHSLAQEMLNFALEWKLPVNQNGEPLDLIDIVGTGGDGKDTFNVSTAAALVVAACGGKIAKHGNRSSSVDKCGSSDFLETLGAHLNITGNCVTKCVEELGFGYLFAREFHPAMKNVAQVRQEIKNRTIFNLLGPLVNPSRPTFQVIGVGNEFLGDLFAQLLALMQEKENFVNRKIPRAFVIHSSDGLDEISIEKPTYCWEILSGKVVGRKTVTPNDFGVSSHPLDKVLGGNKHDRALLFRSIIDPNSKTPPTLSTGCTLDGQAVLDFILINSSIALVVSGIASNFVEGVKIAHSNIQNGNVLSLLEKYVKLSNENIR